MREENRKRFRQSSRHNFLNESRVGPSSLREFPSSFNRHLKVCKYLNNIMEDFSLDKLESLLEASN